jgi:hypothetical protein
MALRIICIIYILMLGIVPSLAAQDESVIPVAKFDSSALVKGVPSGWILDLKKGKPYIDLVKTGDSFCVQLYSNKSSFGIKRGANVDIREYPFLNWEWAATKLPQGGDGRRSSTDDQVLQVYVAFSPLGWPEKLQTPVLGYIWDNEAPKNLTGRSPQMGGSKLRYIIVRNKNDKLRQWYTEKRNIYEDYKKLFADINNGEPTGLTHGIEIFINSQHTGSQAEGFVSSIYFSKN